MSQPRYTPEQRLAAIELAKSGLNNCAIARLTGISVSAVRAYRLGLVKSPTIRTDRNKAETAALLRSIADQLSSQTA